MVHGSDLGYNVLGKERETFAEGNNGWNILF